MDHERVFTLCMCMWDSGKNRKREDLHTKNSIVFHHGEEVLPWTPCQECLLCSVVKSTKVPVQIFTTFSKFEWKRKREDLHTKITSFFTMKKTTEKRSRVVWIVFGDHHDSCTNINQHWVQIFIQSNLQFNIISLRHLWKNMVTWRTGWTPL